MKIIITEAGINGIKGTKRIKPTYSDEYKKEMEKADKRIEAYHSNLAKTAVKSKNYFDSRR